MSKSNKIDITKDISKDLKGMQDMLYSEDEQLKPNLPKGAKLKDVC